MAYRDRLPEPPSVAEAAPNPRPLSGRLKPPPPSDGQKTSFSASCEVVPFYSPFMQSVLVLSSALSLGIARFRAQRRPGISLEAAMIRCWVPSGAKARIRLTTFAARLKSCPDTSCSPKRVFPQPAKPVPFGPHASDEPTTLAPYSLSFRQRPTKLRTSTVSVMCLSSCSSSAADSDWPRWRRNFAYCATALT
jgi:hypothetical protein